MTITRLAPAATRAATIAVAFALSLAAAAAATPPKAAKRIQFKPGESAATLKGTVKETTNEEFVLGAKAGQHLTLRVASPDDPDMVFYLYRPDRKLVDDLATANVAEWSGDLPDTGDYRIVVMGRNGDDDRTLYHYTLDVAVK